MGCEAIPGWDLRQGPQRENLADAVGDTSRADLLPIGCFLLPC